MTRYAIFVLSLALAEIQSIKNCLHLFPDLTFHCTEVIVWHVVVVVVHYGHCRVGPFYSTGLSMS